jgi:HEAT repeat protein
MDDWHFDPISAGIGAVFTLLVTWVVYRWRRTIFQFRDRTRTRARELADKVTASLEERYRDRIVAWASQLGALSRVAPLERIFVSPPFAPPRAMPNPEAKPSTLRQPLSWKLLLSGYPRLILTGDLASGRTSLLAYLALLHARQESTEAIELPADRLPLYVDLPRMIWKERVEVQVEESDEESVAEEVVEEVVEEAVEEGEGTPAEELTDDVLVELSEEEGTSQEVEAPKEKLNPLERLIRGALISVRAPSSYAPALRNNLQEGTALILADGWDELEPEDREEIAVWLGQLADELEGNVWILSTGPRAFFPLTGQGFRPLWLEAWTTLETRALAARWMEIFPPAEEEKRQVALTLNQELRTLLQQGANPMDLNLYCWLFLTGSQPERAHLFTEALDRLLQPPEGSDLWSPVTVRAALSQLALTLQEEEREILKRQEILDALQLVLPPAGERPANLEEQILQALVARARLLQPRQNDTFTFSHPLWHASLASRQLAAHPPEIVLEHLEEPAWSTVIDFYATCGPMEPVIKAWLKQRDDMWYTRLRRLAYWAALAPADVKWRNGVLALLARMLLSPALPLPTRRLVARALVETGDPGVVFFLRKAAGHTNPDVKISALEALGHLAGEADLPTLEKALHDADFGVQRAAVEALGMMGDRAAIHRLTRLLIEAEQELRVEAARALALCGGEAWDILREAMDETDLLTRRAAVFGLAEIREPWTRDLLLQAVREDPEWIVRAAAEMVVEARETPPEPVQPPLKLSESSWLIAWAAARGEVLGSGEAALTTLLEALRHGDAPVRRAAVEALGMIGDPEHIPALRWARKDETAEVAAAALAALEELSRRHGVTIPA